MELLSVRCNHCGAPLEVGRDTRYVTCQFCHSPLEVKRTESAIFTEEVAKIAKNTEQMAGSLEVIELQNDIERLDREWMASQPVSFDKNGRPIGEPTPGGAALQMGFAIFFAVVCFGMAGAMSSFGGGAIGIVPVGMGLFAIIAAIMGIGRAGNHQTRKDAYLQKRAALVARLESMQRTA